MSLQCNKSKSMSVWELGKNLLGWLLSEMCRGRCLGCDEQMTRRWLEVVRWDEMVGVKGVVDQVLTQRCRHGRRG